MEKALVALRRNGSSVLLPGLTHGDPCPEVCVQTVKTGLASAPTRYVSTVLPAVVKGS